MTILPLVSTTWEQIRSMEDLELMAGTHLISNNLIDSYAAGIAKDAQTAFESTCPNYPAQQHDKS